MLSVILPTRNRATLLEKTLKSLLTQTLSQEHFEVIVIDNGSSDNTFDVVNLFKTRLKNIRYFMEFQPGLHTGRHKGAIEAESNLLVFADDDIEALPTWLQAIKDSFDDEKVVMVGGKCLPRFETEPPSWLSDMWSSNTSGERILSYLSVIDLGEDAKSVDPYHIFGCNFAIRRSVLFEAGGFHPDAMPQELIRFRGDGESYVSKYVQVKGYKALYNPFASVYHWVPKKRMTNEYFCQRAYNQGISDSFTAIRCAKGIDSVRVTTNNIQQLFQRLRNKSIPGILESVWRLTRCLSLHVKGQESLAREGADWQRNIAAAYEKGYAYHQEQFRESPELHNWVLKPNYWNCQLPSQGNEELIYYDRKNRK